MPYQSPQEKLQKLAEIVCLKSEIPDPPVSPDVREKGEARLLLVAIAHAHRLVDDGQLQDHLLCSQKEIRVAANLVAGDAQRARAADAIWNTFSLLQRSSRAEALRRKPTMSDLAKASEGAFHSSWEDIRARDSSIAHCSPEMQATVLAARDVLHKNFEEIARVLPYSPSEIRRIYEEGYKKLRKDPEMAPKLYEICRSLGALPPSNWPL